MFVVLASFVRSRQEKGTVPNAEWLDVQLGDDFRCDEWSFDFDEVAFVKELSQLAEQVAAFGKCGDWGGAHDGGSAAQAPPLTLRVGKRLPRNMLARQQRRHRAIEHVADGTQQLRFFDPHFLVGTDARCAGDYKPLSVLGRDMRQLFERRL
jgi:hypothetical protein